MAINKNNHKDIDKYKSFIKNLSIPIYNNNDLEESKSKIEKLCDKPLNLAVVGEFNAGKSSFINMLLNLNNLLPTSILPKTATITKLQYGQNELVEIVKNIDGKIVIETNEDLQSLKKYQNAKDIDDDNYTTNIKEIVITLDKEELKNFTFIDTPGFNQNEILSNLTESIFPEIDIFIWLMTKEQSFKNTEKKILEKIKDMNKIVFFVVNKSDINEEKDIEEIEEHLKNNLKDFKNSDIHFLSSKENYNGKYKANFEKFKLYLQKEALNNDIEISKELLKYELDEFKKIVKNNLNEINNIIQVIQKVQKEIEKNNSLCVWQDDIEELSKILLGKIHKTKSIKKTKYRELDNFLMFYNIQETFDKEFKNELKKYFKPFKEKIDSCICDSEKIITNHKIRDFEEVKEIYKFINIVYPYLKQQIGFLGLKGMLFSTFITSSHGFGFVINDSQIKYFQDQIEKDIIFSFDITIKQLDKLISNFDETLKSNLEQLNQILAKIDNLNEGEI